MEAGKHILLVAQKSAARCEPSPDDLYSVAASASILQMLKLPDGTVKVLVEGTQRARIERCSMRTPTLLPKPSRSRPMQCAERGRGDAAPLLTQFDQ